MIINYAVSDKRKHTVTRQMTTYSLCNNVTVLNVIFVSLCLQLFTNTQSRMDTNAEKSKSSGKGIGETIGSAIITIIAVIGVGGVALSIIGMLLGDLLSLLRIVFSPVGIIIIIIAVVAYLFKKA